MILRGGPISQSYQTPVYYVDLTLKDGIGLNDAIVQAKQINEQSKVAGFYQEALDKIVRQGYDNAKFETDFGGGLDIIDISLSI